jgi:uncharacterized protein
MKKYIFLNKAIFFPKEGILVFGDLHIGYEEMLKENGLTISISQLKETKEEIIKIVEELGKKNFKIKEVILLGDVKHYFPFQKTESYKIKDLIRFLQELTLKGKISIIIGNHERIKIGKADYKEFVIKKDIFFSHGDKYFKEIENKKIKYLVLGHLHPAIYLKEGIKKEKYKCFLTGKFKGKEVIILPSFLNLNEGTPLNEIKEIEGFSIIPVKEIKKFNVHIVGKERIYDFGRFEEIN